MPQAPLLLAGRCPRLPSSGAAAGPAGGELYVCSQHPGSVNSPARSGAGKRWRAFYNRHDNYLAESGDRVRGARWCSVAAHPMPGTQRLWLPWETALRAPRAPWARSWEAPCLSVHTVWLQYLLGRPRSLRE